MPFSLGLPHSGEFGTVKDRKRTRESAWHASTVASVASRSIALQVLTKPGRTVRSAASVYCHLTSTISANEQAASTRVAETVLMEIAKCGCSCRACTATGAIHLSASLKKDKRITGLTVSCVDAKLRALKSSSAAQITSISVALRASRAETSLSLTCLLKELQLTKGTCLRRS